VYCTSNRSPFEIVYSFNLITPLNLIPLIVNERVSLDEKRKANMVKTFHESFQQYMDKNNEQYASKSNKGHRHIVFEPILSGLDAYEKGKIFIP
jgi:hypothetical protein